MMKNNKIFQFERNRYFYGKLMTVRDFEAEQRYMNDKRRLINKLLHGAGIICGLDVVVIDDKTISVEMGAAIDYGGREIVVPSPVIKKLSTIEGYSYDEDAKDAYLCIEYDEKGKEPINAAVNSSAYSSESSEFNRLQETYRLFIRDRFDKKDINTFTGLVEDKQVVYSDNRICISQIIPRYVSPAQEFDLKVVVEQIPGTPDVSFEYKLKLSMLKTKAGEDTLRVSFNNSDLNRNGIYETRYSLLAEDAAEASARLELEEGSFSLSSAATTVNSCRKYSGSIGIIYEAVRERIKKDYFGMTMDKIMEESDENVICLAKISLLKAGEVYIIQDIQRVPFAQYAYNTQLLNLVDKISLGAGNNGFNVKSGVFPLEAYKQPDVNVHYDKDTRVLDFRFGIPVPPQQELSCATGVEVIDIGLNAKMNKKYFSREIEHGLGPGPVTIILGVEQAREEQSMFVNNSQSILFGAKDIFEKSQYEPELPELTAAAIAYAQRGTFCIGIKLLDATDESSVRIRWTVIKSNELSSGREKYGDSKVEVRIVPDTITLKVREKLKLKAVVTGTEYTECRWTVIEKEGGSIDENGAYEAPSTPGVYEVTATSVKYPEIKASAFIVVKE